MKDIDYNNVICLDETSFYQKPVQKYAWGERNVRMRVPMIKDSGKRKTLTLAINSNGITHHKFIDGSSNTTLFLQFLQELVNKKVQQKYILMDNVAFHKSKKVMKFFDENKIQPIFTSPYSPDWNPAEMFFSLFKRTHQRLNHLISDSNSTFEHITNCFSQEIYGKWYRHVFGNIKSNIHR
jgi:transposase